MWLQDLVHVRKMVMEASYRRRWYFAESGLMGVRLEPLNHSCRSQRNSRSTRHGDHGLEVEVDFWMVRVVVDVK